MINLLLHFAEITAVIGFLIFLLRSGYINGCVPTRLLWNSKCPNPHNIVADIAFAHNIIHVCADADVKKCSSLPVL